MPADARATIASVALRAACRSRPAPVVRAARALHYKRPWRVPATRGHAAELEEVLVAHRSAVVERVRSRAVTGASAPGGTAVGGAAFDWLMAGLGAWLIGGLYLDGWAHIHVPALETFFTPWHAVLYSGYIAGAVALAVTFAGTGAGARRARGPCRRATGSPSPARSSSSSAAWPTCCGTSSSGSRRASRGSSARAISCSRSAAGLMVTGPLRAGLAHPAAGRAALARPDAHGRVPDHPSSRSSRSSPSTRARTRRRGSRRPRGRAARRTCRRASRASWSSPRC